MKQHITKEQWDELSLRGKRNLMVWLNNRDSELGENDGDEAYRKEAFLSIGQMVEFIYDHRPLLAIDISNYSNGSLCDRLWQEVKEVLEK